MKSEVKGHSQGKMDARDELHQEFGGHHHACVDAFVPPQLLPWIPADADPGGWIQDRQTGVKQAEKNIKKQFHIASFVGQKAISVTCSQINWFSGY